MTNDDRIHLERELARQSMRISAVNNMRKTVDGFNYLKRRMTINGSSDADMVHVSWSTRYGTRVVDHSGRDTRGAIADVAAEPMLKELTEKLEPIIREIVDKHAATAEQVYERLLLEANGVPPPPEERALRKVSVREQLDGHNA